MSEKSKWPVNQSTRSCNMFECPAFRFEQQDREYTQTTSRMVNIDGISPDEVIKKMGVPMGTCLIKVKRRVVGSECNVSDADFARYMREE